MPCVPCTLECFYSFPSLCPNTLPSVDPAHHRPARCAYASFLVDAELSSRMDSSYSDSSPRRRSSRWIAVGEGLMPLAAQFHRSAAFESSQVFVPTQKLQAQQIQQ